MARIRAATFADAEGIRQLNQRNGIDSPEPSARRAIWEAYPFAAEYKDIPPGWVLEAEGRIVGNLDNVHLLYELKGQPVRGALAAGWAVDPEHRSDSLLLMNTFFRQPGVDLCLGVSASPVASRLLTAMKIPRIPSFQPLIVWRYGGRRKGQHGRARLISG